MLTASLAALLLVVTVVPPDPSRTPDVTPAAAPEKSAAPAKVVIPTDQDAIAQGVAKLVAMQEQGPGTEVASEWPYEGVYRVGGKIPFGYRVGGTAIVSMALMAAPGFAKDSSR